MRLLSALVCIAAVAGLAGARPARGDLGDAARVHAQPPFAARVGRLSPAMRRAMTGVSWHRGCPIGLGRLRVIRLRYVDFDRRAHTGRLIVNARIARRTVRAFRALYAARFPIRRMRPIDAYGGGDRASMAADNTSAFNCRRVTGTAARWSEHAYGRAIDVNPVENPYVSGTGAILPPEGRRFRDRSHVRRGMIVAGGVVTRAFGRQGFRWGGNYARLADYQHFERPR